MTNWLIVFVGGGFGSVLRYLLAYKLNFTSQEYMIIFPYATFFANVISCFILGILIQKQFSQTLHENYWLLLGTGFCGGFSTFSTFAYEIYIYVHKGQLLTGICYTGISLATGILALVVGIKFYQTFI